MKLRMSRIVPWIESMARSARAAPSAGSSPMTSGRSSSDSEIAYRLWMIESWRSWLMRWRSSTIGEALDLLVQPRVLDRDAGVQREPLDELAGPRR